MVNWDEPVLASLTQTETATKESLVDVSGTGFQVTTVLVDGADLLVRLCNAKGDNKIMKVKIGENATAAKLVELNSAVREPVQMQKSKVDTELSLVMPRFGLRTIRLKNFKAF